MGKSLKEWAGLDSFGKREDGTEPTHNELYGMVVEAIGLENLTRVLPWTKKELKKALAEDQHLNNLPLKQWDALAPTARAFMIRQGITSISLANCVSLMKAAARRWAQE